MLLFELARMKKVLNNVWNKEMAGLFLYEKDHGKLHKLAALSCTAKVVWLCNWLRDVIIFLISTFIKLLSTGFLCDGINNGCQKSGWCFFVFVSWNTRVPSNKKQCFFFHSSEFEENVIFGKRQTKMPTHFVRKDNLHKSTPLFWFLKSKCLCLKYISNLQLENYS